MSAQERILHQVEERVLTLTLNRPHKRNALDSRMVEALHSALAEARHDSAVRVVLLRGAGPDFCAGADLAEMERITSMGPEKSHADALRMGDLFVQMRQLTKPVVAAVHGRALGGGCGLATGCDVVLVREDAELGYPEVHLGFVPALVMTVLRRKVSEARAFELATLGERFSAADAVAWGLATRVVSANDFEASVTAYARELARRAPSSVALSKTLLYDLDNLGFRDGMARAAQINVAARLTHTCREGVRRFLERRQRD
ncbi:MAG: enoyl-CoA hydratase/isomerase family protein [Gammaproteobacteria bacterium]|nr:enoyl-CoA hydratase/isomerase family protein [Gammaproteobacteria bacterium]